MKIIQDYLDSLFLSVPLTPETKQAKEDLLAIMEDHFNELIAEGKSEHEAIGAVISEFGSIDEILAELELENAESIGEQEFHDDVIELDEAFDFWSVTRKFAFELSLGILLLCLSISSIVLQDLWGIIGALGIFGFFLFAAAGVGFIISGSMKYGRERKKLEDRPLESEVMNEASEQLLLYDKSFRTGLTVGIGLCILSIPLIIFFSEFLYLELLGISLFFSTVGLGVFLIVYSSIIRHGFSKLSNQKIFISDEDNPGPRAMRATYGDAAPLLITIKKFYCQL